MELEYILLGIGLLALLAVGIYYLIKLSVKHAILEAEKEKPTS